MIFLFILLDILSSKSREGEKKTKLKASVAVTPPQTAAEPKIL